LIMFSVPIIIIITPPLLIVPAIITVTGDRVTIKHGLRTIRIRHSDITFYDIVSYPPSWVNNQYMFPNVQWLMIRKKSGLYKSWYIPTTNATQLMLAIQSRSKI
jgi:hypothetical protein